LRRHCKVGEEVELTIRLDCTKSSSSLIELI
jgi:hypothetical protein